MTSPVEIRRGLSRFQTRLDWLDSRHSFSFANHWDPANQGHGLLLVSNDDCVAPGTGFQTHAHRNMEIITWVLRGVLEHRDSEGHQGVIQPGLAQRMSAGRGIWHSEINPSQKDPVRFIQMWVPPDVKDIDPGYEQMNVSQNLASGEWIPLATGKASLPSAIRIHQRDATLWVGRLKAGKSITLPASPWGHLFVATGEASLEGESLLKEGDAARLTGDVPRRLTAGSEEAEVLYWEMTANHFPHA